MSDALEKRLASRLASLRAARGMPLEELSAQTGISRATLSRLERGEASPTAAMLGRLCAVFGWTLSRLMAVAEAEPPAQLPADAQEVWTDPGTGFRRRGLSPPATGYRTELLEGWLPAGAVIDYPASPVAGLEHHLWMLEGGVLELTVEGMAHRLLPGDTLRWRLLGGSRFASLGPEPVRYLLAITEP
jgi:transcriptional regulator with XRE-family HTH domain